VKSARSENALRLGYLPILEKECAFAELDRYERVAVIDALSDERPGDGFEPVEPSLDDLYFATLATRREAKANPSHP
jgi:hypothetical protein